MSLELSNPKSTAESLAAWSKILTSQAQLTPPKLGVGPHSLGVEPFLLYPFQQNIIEQTSRYLQIKGRGLRKGDLNLIWGTSSAGKTRMMHDWSKMYLSEFEQDGMTLLWDQDKSPGSWTKMVSHVGFNEAESYALKWWLKTNLGSRKGRWAVHGQAVRFASPGDAVYFKLAFDNENIRNIVPDEVISTGWLLQHFFWAENRRR